MRIRQLWAGMSVLNYAFYSEYMEGRSHLTDQDVDGKIFKWTLNKCVVNAVTNVRFLKIKI